MRRSSQVYVRPKTEVLQQRHVRRSVPVMIEKHFDGEVMISASANCSTDGTHYTGIIGCANTLRKVRTSIHMLAVLRLLWAVERLAVIIQYQYYIA